MYTQKTSSIIKVDIDEYKSIINSVIFSVNLRNTTFYSWSCSALQGNARENCLSQVKT